MRPGLIGIAAATVVLFSGLGHDAARAATPGVRLTIGVGGDLLPHLPIVARAHALAGGRGVDFRPLLWPIRRWVHGNTLSFCHIETPLPPASPAGCPRFNSPPALA